ncbi:long tail fiber protein [Pseudomonas phage vB_Pa-PAC2]
MSSKIKFTDQYILSSVGQTSNNIVYLQVNDDQQLVVTHPMYATEWSTLGGLRVTGDQSKFDGSLEVGYELLVGQTSTFNNDMVVNGLVTVNRDSLDAMLIHGNVTLHGNLTVVGSSSGTTPGQVTISDNIMVVNTDDVGPGVTATYSGFEVQRGIPVGETNSHGEPGQGKLPSAGLVWNEVQKSWDLNYNPILSEKLPQNPRIINLGQPVADNDASTKKYVNDSITAALDDDIYLDRLTDVTISSPANKNILQYDSSTSQWRNLPYSFIRLTDVTGVSVPRGYVRWNAAGTQLVYETTIDYAQLTGLSDVAKAGQGSLSFLSDVTLSSLSNTQALFYNGTSWVNRLINYSDIQNTPTNNSYSFIGLNDTNNTVVNNGYVRWNAAGTQLVYETTIDYAQLTGLSDVAKAGQGSLDYLTDVSIGTASSGNVLRYNGTDWVNQVLSYTDLSNTPTNNSYSFIGLNDTNDTALSGGYLRWNPTGTQIVYQSTIDYAQLTGLSSVAKAGQGALSFLSDVTISSPGASNTLRYDTTSSKWVNTRLAYSDLTGQPTSANYQLVGLSDTASTSVPLGYLRWNAAGTQVTYATTIDISVISGKSTVASAGSATLSNLEDAAVTTPAAGNTLIWNTSTNKWTNGILDVSNITNAVPVSRTVSAGTGLSGGGNLSSNITLSVNRTLTDTWYAAASHTHDASNITSGVIANARLPVGSTTAQGILQLTDGVASTSTTTAATPNSVKTAYDLATTKANISHTHDASNITSGTIAVARLPVSSTTAQGIVQLTDGVASTSTTTAATPNSVKTAYDLATTKANASHTHDASNITSGVIANARLPFASTTVYGIVTLLDSVASTSISTAATPNSVKTAYDLATTKANISHTHTPAQVGLSNISNNGNTITGNTTISGALSVTGNAVFNTSDIKLKDNIQPIKNPVELLSKISGYTYTRNDCNNEKQTGIIAQEVETIQPESVREVDGIKTVNHNGIIALLVSAVNELSKEIEELKQQLSYKKRD